MKLTIQRRRQTLNQKATTFAVSFYLALLPEEQQWVEQMSLFKKWLSYPEGCPQSAKCTTPRWTVGDVMAGVHFVPVFGSRGSTASLLDAQHAEADVKRGCELLAGTIEDARRYQGVEEIFFGKDESEAAP